MKMKLLQPTKIRPDDKPGAIIDVDCEATARELLDLRLAESLEDIPARERGRAGDSRPGLPSGPVYMKLLQLDKAYPDNVVGDIIRVDDPATARHFQRSGIASIVEDPPPKTAMKETPARNAAKPEGKPRDAKRHAEPDPDNSAGD